MTDTAFAAFADDHGRHRHCARCAGCILNPDPVVQDSAVIWCVACRDTLKKSLPYDRMPWEWEMLLIRGGADGPIYFCNATDANPKVLP